VEMSDEASVDRCVHRLNGKLVPGSNPVSTHYMLDISNIRSSFKQLTDDVLVDNHPLVLV
jgi:hypothetical protein